MATFAKCVSFLIVLGLLSIQGCASGPPPTSTEMGEAALGEGDWRRAKSHFSEALRFDSASTRAWLGQARAQRLGRDPEGSLRSLTSLSRLDIEVFRGVAREDYANTLEDVARGRSKRKQSASALAAIRALKKLDSDRRGLDLLLGRILISEAERRSRLGEIEEALSLYREAYGVVPGNLAGWVGAAEILIEQGQGKAAIKLLQAARKRHPTAGSIRTLTIQALSTR